MALGMLSRNGTAGWKLLAQHPVLMAQEHKLMRDHMKREKQCAVCGTTKKLQCHHTTPLWKSIEQASKPAMTEDGKVCRFMSLCQPCHLRWGHDFDFGHRYVENISMTAACMREIKRSEVVVRRVYEGVATTSGVGGETAGPGA